MPLCEFLPRVFVGSSDEADDVELLESMDIRAVLTCGTMYTPWCSCGSGFDAFEFGDFNKYTAHDDIALMYHNGERHRMKHLAIDIFDTLDTVLSPHLKSGLDFVDKALHRDPEGAVLIHCYAGQSRSVAFCIAFMMRCSGEGVQQCLERMRAVYPDAKPNASFLEQLEGIEMEMRLKQPNPIERKMPRLLDCRSRSMSFEDVEATPRRLSDYSPSTPAGLPLRPMLIDEEAFFAPGG